MGKKLKFRNAGLVITGGHLDRSTAVTVEPVSRYMIIIVLGWAPVSANAITDTFSYSL